MKNVFHIRMFFIATLLIILLLTACGYRPSVPPSRPLPEVLPELPSVYMVSTTYNTMVIGTDGSLWAEGFNINGELADGSTIRRTFFDQVGTFTDWVHVDAGSNHIVAIREDGRLWTWGGNRRGGLGNNTRENSHVPVIILIGRDRPWRTAAAGLGHTVAIQADGSLWAWGSSSSGQLGNGIAGGFDTDILVPIQVGTDTDWAYVFAYWTRTMAIKTDGSLWGWGYNEHGDLGDGTREARPYPTLIQEGTSWATIALSSRHTLGIRTDGSLWAWGDNWNGQLGDGTTTSRLSPVQVGTYTDWTDVAAGFGYTIAIRADGSLWVWGTHATLFFGDLAERDSTIPTQIHPYEHWVSVAAGNNRAFAVTHDGRLLRLG